MYHYENVNVFKWDLYSWGNIPAIDVLNLKNNEGIDYQEDLSLVFAGTIYDPSARMAPH